MYIYMWIYIYIYTSYSRTPARNAPKDPWIPGGSNRGICEHRSQRAGVAWRSLDGAKWCAYGG